MRLYLVSLGLQPADPGGDSSSIPRLVNRVIERMEAASCGGHVDNFLSRLSESGAESGDGYDHNTMYEDSLYITSFLTASFRAYDMSDEAVEVLRREDVVVRHHVDVSSVRFRVDLPVAASISNPVSGANQVVQTILTA
ncbi:hypothetical protein [Arthrobacter sp. KK5.5]|uniref:hypothetical protein n=1 Tax=Arthrobacter sp. KK5.5 TaxID=3373084 RepID=UPI003EE56903